MSRIRVLFVDDDPFLLQAQRRVLWGTTNWDAEFVDSGTNALAEMAKKEFDAVVSDVRMPVMDGVQLLAEVQKRHPQTLRVILSGQNEQEGAFCGLGPAQRYMSKPCEPNDLVRTVNQSVALYRSLPHNAFDRLIVQNSHLVSLPEETHEILRCAHLPDANKTDVAHRVAAHPNLATMFTRFTNATANGCVTDEPLEAATNRLSWELVRPLLLSAAAFSHVCKDPSDPQLSASIERSVRIGSAAMAFARELNADVESTAYAVTAGLVMDLGAICFAQHFPIASTTCPSDFPDGVDSRSYAVQAKTYGLDQDQMTACLLQRWGIPYGIMEAVTFRHFGSNDAARVPGDDANVVSIPRRAVEKAVAHEYAATGA